MHTPRINLTKITNKQYRSNKIKAKTKIAILNTLMSQNFNSFSAK